MSLIFTILAFGSMYAAGKESARGNERNSLILVGCASVFFALSDITMVAP